MITKEQHEAIEIVVATANRMERLAKDAGLKCIVSFTLYSFGPECAIHVYRDGGDITNPGVSLNNYDSADNDLQRIARAIKDYEERNTESGKLQSILLELRAKAAEVENRLKELSDGKDA